MIEGRSPIEAHRSAVESLVGWADRRPTRLVLTELPSTRVEVIEIGDVVVEVHFAERRS